MKSILLTTLTLLTFFLAGCDQSGDYCYVYTPVPPIDTEISAQLVSKNRSSAAAIVTNETSYARRCVG